MDRSGHVWWVAWVLWCVPAGAVAGIGLIEFNWGGPPYDGGFMGELVLFGGFIALGQAPFVALFVRALHASAVGSGGGYVAAVLVAVSWSVVGFAGWTTGSYFEVGLPTPLYSGLSVLAGVLPWVCVGAFEGILMAAALASVRGLWAAVASGIAWVAAGAVGGLFYECWDSFDVAARQNPLKDGIGASLEGVGVAENVAFEVASTALALPVLYGVPTGLALVAIRRTALRRS